MTKFITDDDIKELESHGINHPTDINIFIIELTAFFNKVWDEQYHIFKKYDNIDDFNKEVLENYPSWTGYYILDDAFTGSIPTVTLSHKSKFILSYLYCISLR